MTRFARPMLGTRRTTISLDDTRTRRFIAMNDLAVVLAPPAVEAEWILGLRTAI